jgi:hypothetical protein
MKCEGCGSIITGLKRRYFSRKLRCPCCNHVVYVDEKLEFYDYLMDLKMLFGIVQDGNRN